MLRSPLRSPALFCVDKIAQVKLWKFTIRDDVMCYDEDEIFFGKIEGIDDLVSFEGNTASGLKQVFEKAVNDYVILCKEKGKKIEKLYKGSFNVRIVPEIHKKKQNFYP